MEMLSAKEDGYLPGLAYLDTARGIRPIVEKLPYTLQEKWISQGSKYKEEFGVSYPPFSFFTQFICNHASCVIPALLFPVVVIHSMKDSLKDTLISRHQCWYTKLKSHTMHLKTKCLLKMTQQNIVPSTINPTFSGNVEASD